MVCFCGAFWCRVKVHKLWDFTPPRVDFAYLPASHPQTFNFKGESEQVTFFHKRPSWCLPGAHRVEGELGTNPSLSSKKNQFSIVKISFFRIFAKKKSLPLVSQITSLYRAPPHGKNAKNLLDHCSFSEKVISPAPRP